MTSPASEAFPLLQPTEIITSRPPNSRLLGRNVRPLLQTEVDRLNGKITRNNFLCFNYRSVSYGTRCQYSFRDFSRSQIGALSLPFITTVSLTVFLSAMSYTISFFAFEPRKGASDPDGDRSKDAGEAAAMCFPFF